jgi:precorrin-2 dehydrogenase / sirohydrochlorin ferrochelatase
MDWKADLVNAAPLFPIFLKLEGRNCLVVGAGLVGEGKIRGLIESGALVRVISPQATPQVRNWSQSGSIAWESRPFTAADLNDIFLVVAATSSRKVNDAIYAEAQGRGVLCNVVDVPDRCDFYYPSVVRRGNLQIAISTAGDSPTLAQRLRQDLENQLPEEYFPWLDEIGRERRALLASEPDPARRLKHLRELSSQASFERYLARTTTQDRKEFL